MRGYKFNKESKGKVALPAWAQKNQEILERWVNGNEAARTYIFDIDETVELYHNALHAKFDQFKVGDRIGGRYGYLPDALKDPKNPDSKNFNPPKITITPEGYTRVIPEHLRVSTPVVKGSNAFINKPSLRNNCMADSLILP